MERFRSFSEFYPFYLSEHSRRATRILHFLGTLSGMLVLVYALIHGPLRWLWLAPVCGYFFAWVSHFFVEKNRPATFKYPKYSLMGDFRMFFEILTGRIKF